jgi:hypothetical protein
LLNLYRDKVRSLHTSLRLVLMMANNLTKNRHQY